MSNMMAMVMARYVKFPQVKTKGLAGLPGQPVVFASEDASAHDF